MCKVNTKELAEFSWASPKGNQVISGRGVVRHADGTSTIETGDALFLSQVNPTNLSTTAPRI
jgi:hypothetical protein